MRAPAIDPSAATADVEIDGRRLRLTNLDKVLWPDAGFTKRQMISYYVAIAPVLLPHLADRPLTLKRYPDGVDGWFWFQTRCRHHPSWMRTVELPSASRSGERFDYCVVDDLASLVWVANLASIELHPLLSATGGVDHPRAMVFDLDPGPAVDVIDCCEIALRLRETLDRVGLASFPKTSGLKGLHVYVPLNLACGYTETKAFARNVARLLKESHPERVVDRSERSLRAGKVLVDWSQNNAIRSTVAAYSLRAARVPAVSTPLEWREVEEAIQHRNRALLAFDAADVLERMDALGDPFRPVLQLQQTLPA